MVILTAPWRTKTVPAVAKPRRVRPMRRHGWAASTQDRFMDAIVLLSVVVFLLLAIGCGVLVLQATWPG